MSEPTPAAADSRPKIYTGVFWAAYVANVMLVMANVMQFRFAEFVTYLVGADPRAGGAERLVGWIVCVGGIGALLTRFEWGRAMDRHGTGRLWRIASLLFCLGVGGFIFADQVAPRQIAFALGGWAFDFRFDVLVWVGRIAYAIGLAGMFACSMTFVQNLVPPRYRTEVIASLGSSGFLGMMIGAVLGDIIYGIEEPALRFHTLFGVILALGVVYSGLVFAITRRQQHTRPKETPGVFTLLSRYRPGIIVYVSMMLGFGFATTGTFLTRYASSRGIDEIGFYLFSYAISAFVFRVLSRTWPDKYGASRLIHLGVGAQAVGYLCVPLATVAWHFVPIALLTGFGHALLFPVVVSIGAGVFPQEYRGTGTTVIMGFMELGGVLGAPLLGWIITRFGYPAMYGLTAALTIAGSLGWALERRRRGPIRLANAEETIGDRPKAKRADTPPEPVVRPNQAGPAATDAAAEPVGQAEPTTVGV